MISRRADSVVGVEIDPEALTHATSRYRRPGAAAMWPLDEPGPCGLETTTVPAKIGSEEEVVAPIAPQFRIAICGLHHASLDEHLHRTISVFMDSDQSFVAEHDDAHQLRCRVPELETHDALLLSIKDRPEEERDQLKSRAEALAAENVALRSNVGWRIIRRLGRALSGLRSWRPRAS